MSAARELITTREAAELCGYRSTGAIRKAVMERRLVPVGRRGGKGTHVFELTVPREMAPRARAVSRG